MRPTVSFKINRFCYYTCILYFDNIFLLHLRGSFILGQYNLQLHQYFLEYDMKSSHG